MTSALEDVCIVIVDSEHKTAPTAEPGTEYALSVGTPHVRNGRLLLGDAVAVDEDTYRKWTVREVPKVGDLILTREAPVGEVGMIPARARICLRQRTVLLRPDPEEVSGRFLLYLLMTPQLQDRMHSKGAGSTVPHLNIKDVRTLSLGQLPGLKEQECIAEVLGALDDKIALNARICGTSLNLADCYSQLVYRDGDGGTVATVAQLVSEGQLEFGDGYRTKRAEHGQPGLPILRVAEVADGDIHPAFADYVRDEFRSAMKGKVSRAGDVVLTTKGTVGRVALITADHPEFVYSPQVCYFRLTERAKLSNIYLFHWMRGPEFWRQAAGMKGQTDMADYLSLGDIKSLRLTLPSHAALTEFNSKCAPLHAQSAAARNENRTLTALRDTLLPQLLSGKLRVKDAVRSVEEVV